MSLYMTEARQKYQWDVIALSKLAWLQKPVSAAESSGRGLILLESLTTTKAETPDGMRLLLCRVPALLPACGS